MAKKAKTVARQLHVVDPGPDGETQVTGASPLLIRTIDRFLAVQRPVVIGHLHSTEDSNMDKLLAKGWHGVAEMIEMMRKQVREIAMKKVN